MTLRTTWRGDLRIGPIILPVGFANQVTDKDIKFSQFTDDLHPVGRQAFDKETGEILSATEIRRGQKIGDTVVLVSDEEIESLAPESSKSVEIIEFVSNGEIDPAFYETHYLVVPEIGYEPQYAAVLAGLERNGAVGIGKTVRRTKEHLVALRVLDKAALVVSFLNYADEVRTPRDINLTDAEPDPTVSGQIETLVRAQRVEWEPAKYADNFRAKVLTLIQDKVATLSGSAVPF